MTAYVRPTTAFNIKDRASAPRLAYDPTLDPTRHGWQQPVIGTALYLLPCGRFTFQMKFSYMYSFKTCGWQRVWVIYAVATETGDTVGEPVIYDTGCDLDAMTDALIDYADNFEVLLEVIQEQHFGERLEVYRAHEASKADWLTDNLPATDSRPDNAWIAPEFGGERYGLHRSEF